MQALGLVGRGPGNGDTAVEVALHHLNTPPQPLPKELSQYQRLLDKLLDKDRDARFRNSDEVLGFLARNFAVPGSPPDKTQRLH